MCLTSTLPANPAPRAQSLSQKRPQRRAVDTADLGDDGVDVEAVAVQQGLRVLDAQVLVLR